jgi:hypothetical protein
MLVYLGICAVLAFISALVTVLPAPTFPGNTLVAISPAATLHLFFAAGALPLIFGAIVHFVPVLTRTGTPSGAIRFIPIPVQIASVVTVGSLAGLLPYRLLHVTATVVGIAAVVLLVWVSRCLRATLGTPHPGARWYGAALLCLFFAVTSVPVWLAVPELRQSLRLFHLHANTVGFIGLAALGTLPVLLPTALSRPDPRATLRLRGDLPWAVAGVLLIAAGAASAAWLSLIGAMLMLWGVVRMLLAWGRAYRLPGLFGDGATLPLFAATMGFGVLMLHGIVHGLSLWSARPSILGFVGLFLLPLVTGALSQLLPVWRHPGMDSTQRRAMRARLVQGGYFRAGLFVTAGLLLLAEVAWGWVLLLVGVGLFAFSLLKAFWLDRGTTSDDNRGLPR